MPDVLLKDEFGIEQPYEDINAVLLNTVDSGTATYISPDIIPAHPNTHPASMITGLVVKDLPSLEIASYEFIYSDTFGCYMYTLPKAWDDLLGTTYKITWDGEEYTRVCRDINEINETMSGSYYIGNPAKITNVNIGEDTGEPFFILFSYGEGYIFTDDSSNSHRFSITPIDEVKKLDFKYLPDGLATQEWVNNEISKIDVGGSGNNTAVIDILPEQDMIFTPVDGDEGLFQFATTTKENEFLQILSVLKPGETYYVAIDGVEYECTAQSCFELGAPRPANSEIYADAALGNIGIANPEFTDTGEPFVVMVLSYAQFSDDGSISNENHNAAIVVTGEASAESVTRSVRIYKKIEESNNYIKWDELIREDNVTTETDLFERQTINTFIEDSNYGGVYAAGMNFPESGYTNDLVASFDLEIGESYIVEWDGAAYPVVGQDGSAVMPNTTILGDGSSFGIGESTGEPFVIGVAKNSGVMFASLTETIESHTIRIYTSTSSVETNIKSEFLPSHLQFGKVNGTISLINTDVKFTYVENNGWNHNQIPITSDIHLELGETYTVEWDGTIYMCDAISVQGMFIGVGNPWFIDGEDNGLPFAIAEDINGAIFGTPSFIMMTNEVDNIDTSITTELLCNVKITYTGIVSKKIDAEYLYQTDWNENNNSSASYLQNRPFGMIPAGTVMAERASVDCNLEFSENEYVAFIPTVGFIPGVTYRIELDGISVDLTAEDFGEEGIGVAAGGRSIIDNFNNSAITILICTTQGTHTYKVTVIEDAIKKIDPKYLPDDIGGSSLPEVTTSNNGQVMTVVNGEWTAQTPASELPTVTSSDTGKFLRVDSSGNWVAETIPNAEGVSF